VGAAPFVAEALRWSVDSGSDALPPASPVSKQGPGQAGAARILLADDNADMRAYITRLLRDRWSIEAVADGASALARAREAPPDLILSDVMMPGLDGFQLLQALQADPQTRGIPVIFLSARAGEESRIEGLTAGADDYLVKPFSARELIARVGTRLEMTRGRREVEAARKLVVDQIPAGVIVAEAPSGRTLLANERVRSILGYPALPTHSIGDFAAYTAVHPDGRPFAAGEYALTRALAGEVILDEEILLMHADGTRRTLSASAAPVYDGGGKIIAAVNAFSDISDRKREEEQRQQLLLREREARAEAEVANRSKDEFLAMLGHELRNPLAPIVTALHLMRLRGDETLQRERTIIERQVSHLVRLVDDLLDISRVTRGKVDLKRERIEMSEIVAKAIEMASPLIEQRQHQLAIDVPKGLILEADAVRMSQVVANLLNNAAKYTEAHGTITVTAGIEDGEIVLRVRDTGIGLSAEMLPRVFDLFVQEHQALDRAQGGLGLGLAIVRSLVELHGGRVEARSEGHGRGTELLIRLPPASTTTEPAPSGEPLRERKAATRPDALRVLVVDDNADTAELMAESVRMMGHVAQVAHDGPAALRIAAQLHPDVALLDIGLPVMDGYELARHLRALPGLAALRLVAVTGYDQEADRRHTEAAGFERHLVKPIHFEQLEEVLVQESAEPT
jgi:PAS domain S-box-containing protein